MWLVLLVIIALPLMWGLVAKIATDAGFPIWPFGVQEAEPTWEYGEIEPGTLSVTRKLGFTGVDKYNGTASAGTITLYSSDGKTLLETLTLSSGSATSSDSYESGVILVMEVTDGNSKLRQTFTVPGMAPADVEAVTNNPISFKDFTVASSVTRSGLTGAGTAIAADGNLNKTIEGNVVSLTIMLNVPTDQTGYISSKDEIDNLNWWCVLYMKVSGTNYEYVGMSGWSYSYTKGTAEWYATRIADTEITKYKVGNEYEYDGATSFTCTLDLTGYSEDAANLDLYLYGYSDPDYHKNKGSFGPDSYAMMTTMQINLVD